MKGDKNGIRKTWVQILVLSLIGMFVCLFSWDKCFVNKGQQYLYSCYNNTL